MRLGWEGFVELLGGAAAVLRLLTIDYRLLGRRLSAAWRWTVARFHPKPLPLEDVRPHKMTTIRGRQRLPPRTAWWVADPNLALLCSNCHRGIHRGMTVAGLPPRQRSACQACGFDDVRILEWHHIIPRSLLP